MFVCKSRFLIEDIRQKICLTIGTYVYQIYNSLYQITTLNAFDFTPHEIRVINTASISMKMIF